MRILIVGAGPVGLTTALAMAHRGVSCRIVERRTEPSILSRAVGITPATMSMLESIGAAKDIRDEAMAIEKVIVKRNAKTLFEVEAREFGPNTPTMLGLPQNRTEEILRNCLRAKGIEVEYGCTVQCVSADASGAIVVFANDETTQFDWVVGADGVQSIVRKNVGIAYPGFEIPGEWAIADVDIEEPFESNAITAYSFDGNFGLTLPIEKHRARIVSTTTDALAALPEALPIKNIRRTATFKISVRQVEIYQKHKVLLAGDAAHCHSPVGGRGMNLGMTDGFAAANAIVDGTAEQYSTARHKAGAKTIAMSERARKMLTASGSFASVGFWIAGKILSTSKTARRIFWKNLTGT